MPIVLRDKEIDPPSGYLLIGSSRPGDHTLPDIFCCSCCSLGFFRFCCSSSNGQAEEASNVSVCSFRFSKTDRNWLGPVYTSPPPSPRTTRSWWLTTEHPNIIDGTSGVFTYFEESKLVGHRQRHGTSNRWSNGFAQLTGKVIKVRTPLSFLRRNKRKTTFSC